VTGDPDNMPDTSFSFEATFTKDGEAYTDAISYTKGTVEGSFTPVSGKVTFTLKDGESLEMTIPSGVAYTVTETSIPADFTLTSPSTGSVTGTMTSSGATAAFTNNFANTVDIVGTKTWADNENAASARPDSISLELWQHLEDTDESADTVVVRNGFTGAFTASASNSWQYKFSGMPKYSGGKLITYYVKETTVPDGYTFSYTTTEKSMNITNTYTNTQVQTYDLTLKKLVKGDFGDKSKPFSFTITLKDADGAAVTGSFDVETSSGVTGTSISNNTIAFVNGTATVSLSNEQEIKIKALPEGYQYEIQESLDGNDLYTKTIAINDAAVSGQSEGNTGTRTLQSDETVTYTNTAKDIAASGFDTNLRSLTSFVILALLLAGCMTCFYMERRRRNG
jgi:hypothetical protein